LAFGLVGVRAFIFCGQRPAGRGIRLPLGKGPGAENFAENFRGGPSGGPQFLKISAFFKFF
jgi:hypothetical protein